MQASACRRLASTLRALEGGEPAAAPAAAERPALPGLRKTLVEAPASGIRDLMVKSAALEAARKPDDPRVIHLEVGQPDHPTPPHILQATSEAVLTDPSMTQYIANAGIDRLRELVAERITRESPSVVTTMEHCLVTPGAVASMASAFAVCLDPGTEVLVPDPGWPNYGLSATILGATLVPYPCPATNAWLPDIDALAAAVTDKTRMIVLCNPSNPTGAVIPESLLRQILELAAARGLFVLADEIYHDISYDDEPPASTLEIAQELDMLSHVLLIGGASKSFAMTGFRVGWLRATEDIIEQGKKCQEAFTSCGVPFAQAGACAALEGDQDVVTGMRDSYKQRRDIAVATLEKHGMAPAAIPGGAFYMLLPCSTVHTHFSHHHRRSHRRRHHHTEPRRAASDGAGALAQDMSVREDSTAFCLELLEKKFVATAPGATFGDESEGFIRISLAAADEDIEEGIERLCEFIQEREA